MQIEIYNPTQGSPLPPIKWNYAEVKEWVQKGLDDYKGRVYTAATIADAKKDRATLNKLADAIDAKRKEMKALYLEPYAQFEAEAKELTAMIKGVNGEIDAQIKAYDEIRKKNKQAEILVLYEAMIGDLAPLVPYERLHNPKWLNVTASMSAVSEELGFKIDRIVAGMASINTLGLDPDMAERVKAVFLKDFDLAAALAERERIEKQREALAQYEAAKKAEQPAPPQAAKITPAESESQTEAKISAAEPLIELDFRVWVTTAQMGALRDFLKTNGIKYGRVPDASKGE